MDQWSHTNVPKNIAWENNEMYYVVTGPSLDLREITETEQRLDPIPESDQIFAADNQNGIAIVHDLTHDAATDKLDRKR